jgi:hypothetical protein
MSATRIARRKSSEIALAEPVNNEMRMLLRSWRLCMQKPRARDWEKTADRLCRDTWLLLGKISRHEHDAGRRD